MAVAAFILSVVAIVIAGASAWYTRRQAVSTEGVQRVEEARRHEELSPDLEGRYVETADTREGKRPGVRLTNRGPLDLERVEVAAIPPHRANEAVIEGIYDYRTGGTATRHETGMLRLGEAWTFDVLPARDIVEGGHELDRGGIAQFRCRCRAKGHAPWEVVVSVDFPASPWVP
jgi:hypothetical protein